MEIKLGKDKETKQPAWLITFSKQYITERMIDITDKRIERAKVALKVCKHSKRKAKLEQKYDVLIQVRERLLAKVATQGGTDD